jgi:glycosyltransferase involved in cell wall biosynthesis
MHILMIPSWFQPLREGHTGIFVRDIALGLAQKGHIVRILSFNYGNEYLEISQQGITEIFHPNIATSFLAKVFQPSKVTALLSQYVQKYGLPDIINTHGIAAIRPVNRWASKNKIPIIHHEHLIIYARSAFPIKLLVLAKLFYPRVKKIIAVSNYQSGTIVPLTSTPVVCIPPIIDEAFFKLSTEKLVDDGFHLVSVGDLDPIKGHSFIIEALNLLKKRNIKFTFHLIGDGPLLSEIIQQCKKYQLTDSVIFHGKRSRKEICTIFQKCQLYISGSILESFGLHIAEALAGGLFVVTTDCKSVHDYIKWYSGTIVEKRSTKGFADAIENAMIQYKPADVKRIKESIYQFASASKVIPATTTEFLSCLPQEKLHQ